MEKVQGIGGIFFKANDPKSLQKWYEDNLGIAPQWSSESGSGRSFTWREAEDPEKAGSTVWSLFKSDTEYFSPGKAAFMVNYRVTDLAAMLKQLREAGAEVDDRIEESEFGKFGWVIDPDGNRIELWEPPDGM